MQLKDSKINSFYSTTLVPEMEFTTTEWALRGFALAGPFKDAFVMECVLARLTGKVRQLPVLRIHDKVAN